MKERILYDDEFERQLKEKADQFKMYPSDKVWNGVYSSLHTRRRRFVAGMTILIGSILILSGVQLLHPSKNSVSKPYTSKWIEAVKPAPAADLRAFKSNRFTDAPDLSQTPSAEPENPNPETLNIDRFGLPVSASIAPDQKPVKEDFNSKLTEKTISTNQEKNKPTAETNVPDNKLSVITIQELNAGNQTTFNNTEINELIADLGPENSATQLSHIHNDRFSWRIYIAPTLNTRYLSGPTYPAITPQSVQRAPIMVVHFANVNGFVDNTPAMGYDIGGSIQYRISKNLSLKAGLEFNFSRYYIKAFNSGLSQASATLSPYLGYIPDSLANNGNTAIGTNKNPQHYQNKYYQLSIPVGIEMKVAGNDRLQLHLGTTLQPSYLLNTDAYVLSDDYSSYTKEPQIFRKWNLNVGAELFISYRIGQVRWELGPAIRYQLLSTYKDNYPIKENMLNYGIRLGFSKTIR